MTDRYARYPPRASSPKLYNPARLSMPIVSHSGHDHTLHAIPTRREVIATTPRSSADHINAAAPYVTTTYKIKPEVPGRTSSVREAGRPRRSTLESGQRPPVIHAAPRHHHAVHASTARPASPLANPYRSSDEAYDYAVPASSGKHRSSHRRVYSATVDNADVSRLAREGHTSDRLRTGSGREPVYAESGPRRHAYPIAVPAIRHPDTVADDYGDDGYGYTNPRDLVSYDLDNTQKRHHRQNSADGHRSRPTSISSYADLAPRGYDPRERERGPPPTTRGFDKIPARTPTYDPPVRMPEPVSRPRGESGYESAPRTSTRRPVSVYQERDNAPAYRDDYYDPRYDESRDRREGHRPERRDDTVEQRGFGLRAERPDYDDRPDRAPEKKSSGREALTAGLSIAASALGFGAVAKAANSDERDEPRREEDRRRRDESQEPRSRRDVADEKSVDPSGRDHKGRPPREDRDREAPEPTTRDRRDRGSRDENEYIDLHGRNPQERVKPRDDRTDRDELRPHDPRERRRHHRDRSTSAVNSRNNSPPSEESSERRQRKERAIPETQAPFNPNDPMDLRALKEALNNQDTKDRKEPTRELVREPARDATREAPREQARELPRDQAREPPREQPRESPREAAFDPRDARDLHNIQAELKARDERGRRDMSGSSEEQANNGNSNQERQLRVVSPPREKVEDKPVKGILRQPREKFPEDPAPIREGVAPLKDAKKDGGVPADARWTKISRKLVNPAALDAGKERYEARDDFVIVLRVLNREEVQAYATKTQQIRGMLVHYCRLGCPALQTPYSWPEPTSNHRLT